MEGAHNFMITFPVRHLTSSLLVMLNIMYKEINTRDGSVREKFSSRNENYFPPNSRNLMYDALMEGVKFSMISRLYKKILMPS